MTFEETNKILTDTIKELVIPTVETGLSEISVIYMLEERTEKERISFREQTSHEGNDPFSSYMRKSF